MLQTASIAAATGGVAALAARSAARSGGGFADVLKSAISRFKPQDADSAESAAGPPSRDGIDKSLAAFRETFQRLLEESGIDTSQPVSLQLDSFGGLQAVGDHTQKDAIQGLLAEHPELLAQFQDLQQSAEQLRSQGESFWDEESSRTPPTSEFFPESNPSTFSLMFRNGTASIAFV